MTLSMILVLGLVASSVILFATEKLPVDLTAMILMATMLLSGLISPQEALGGFSNPATVTVGAMFILSAGLYKTGAVNPIGALLGRLGKTSFLLALVAMMLLVGSLSAFINNTAVVAIFLPVALGIARESGASAARLLLPLSFASMFGGVCTLVGTSTNIVVSSVAESRNLPPFGMFEFTKLGLIFFAAGFLYLILAGVWLIPKGTSGGGRSPSSGSGDYQIEIVLAPDARSVGHYLSKSSLLKEVDIRAAEVFRGGARIGDPDNETLRAGDHLKVRCDLENFRKLKERRGIVLRQEIGPPTGEEAVLVEAVVASGSPLDGRSLKEVRFRTSRGLSALAIRHRGHEMRENLEEMPLRGGDVLLFQVEESQIERLREDPSFVLVSPVGLPVFRKSRMGIALLIVAGVVGAAAAGAVPITAGAIIGCCAMILCRCLTLEEAYAAINWKVIFLLAGVLTLGTAMEKSGAAAVLAGLLVDSVGSLGPVAMVSGFYLVTSLLTEVMSNSATAALLAPVAISAADGLGIDSRPLLVAIAFAASSSFMTPFGYQTNTLIYGPGRFRYADFLRVGTPLNILFWVIATFLIPRFWPF